MKKTAKKVTKQKKVTHKKHSQKFIKVYWPYIPIIGLVFLGLIFGYDWRLTPGVNKYGGSGVLAYATEMSTSGLLSATNTQRQQNNAPALTLNAKLASAAQAKANDMVARNYWSHTTPDGKDPWVFIDAVNYSYQKAGENLAYGFDSSKDTVVGWMNSPSHRTNMLDSSFREVGFGFANASSFVGTGEETIVVAMYANPTGDAENSTQTTAQPQVQQSKIIARSAPTEQPTKQDTVIAGTDKITPQKNSDSTNKQPVTSESTIPAALPAKRITKLQTITAGVAPWSASLLSGLLLLVVFVWLAKHAYAVKRVLINGEKFLLHHPFIDVGVLLLVGVAILLSQSSGVIK
ncbi:CAP domain-containing protein [bacterium]|nr:CAP domain-containing protein [bacterium]NBX98444.1 CAP domain-containing protein [bacterium]NDC94114.1 CAP domain-containing protein [bacterium]NDD83345.1 CAP domain-containing protein [bacterium]NDG28923.1 CAP domain-containing protein [bacterium]